MDPLSNRGESESVRENAGERRSDEVGEPSVRVPRQVETVVAGARDGGSVGVRRPSF
jgi:hypothetical protein